MSISAICRKIVPLKLRLMRHRTIVWFKNIKLKDRIFDYYNNLSEVDNEIKEIIDYLKYNTLSVFPYEFTKKYNAESIEVFIDNENGLKYVIWCNKKMYFPPNLSKKSIKNIILNIYIEQDQLSPHCYLTRDFDVENDDIVVDVGGAEGCFALSVIEKASKMYIFEPDKNWFAALKVTMAPWKDKVIIINKYASNINKDNHVTLDDYFGQKCKINFLKIDAEGFEPNILNGAKDILRKNTKLKLSVCTYHKQNDATEIHQYLEPFSFNTSFSRGYMLYYWDKNITEPFFRRGLLRAAKQNIPFYDDFTH